jgi:hypothetical protein
VRKEGAVNHDLRLDPARPWVTVAHDLNDVPWPWDDNQFDQLVASAVLEHLRIDLLHSMAECWRILRPEGTIWVKVPYAMSERSYDDPTHYWRYGLRVFNVFDPDTREGKKYTFYTPYKWRFLEPVKLNDAGTSIIAKMQVRK